MELYPSTLNGRLVLCHRRAKGGKRKKVQQRWVEEVAGEVNGLAGDLGFTRYSQVHTVAAGHLLRQGIALSRSRLVASLVVKTTESPNGGPNPDGHIVSSDELWDMVDELWWPSVDEMLTALTSKAGIEALRYLRNLTATSTRTTAAVVCKEYIIASPKPEPAETCRVSFALRPRPQDTPEQMQRYWLHDHARLVRSLADDLGFLTYDQAHAVLDDARVPVIVDALGGKQPRELEPVADESNHLSKKKKRPLCRC